MDCNKEEASRAKTLAEEKMVAGDFVGAQKLLTTAQRLFPSLEYLPQMIATCDVHSSAAEKLKGLDNWYAILQVQPFADADTIKKQFRKLALLLHPDKNQFAGAEAAFKLIGEGKRVLFDPIKRSQYDIRYRSHSIAASREANANSGRQYTAANTAAQNLASGYTFWTCCKHCGHRWKYLREFMNNAMFCSICRNSYIAYDIGCDRVPPSSSSAKQFQDNTSQQNASTGAEPEISAAEMDKNGTDGGKLNKNNQDNQKRGGDGVRNSKKDEGRTENGAEGGKPLKGETGVNNSAEIPKAGVLKPQPEVKEPETSAAKSVPDLSAPRKKQAAKKRRKTVEEPSKSFEVDSSNVSAAKTDTNVSNKRKSSRKKPQVTYAEGGSNGDFVSPPTKKTKSGCESESDSNKKQKTGDNKSTELADSGVSLASSHAYKGKAKQNSGNEEILSAKNKESEGGDGNVEDVTSLNKIDRVEKGNKANENPNTLDIPDPEFNEFEAERKTENFAVNQVWSICDSVDGMPRRYARVKKVLDAEFKLRITCLEPVRGKSDEIIPIGCGKFKNGETKVVEERSIFSGQMLYSSVNKTVIIYPRKGEIWAIFREWKEEWNTSLKKHILPYKYDIVEVVNDFTDMGIGVAYLGKCKGHLSQFHQEAQNGVIAAQFTAEEIFRFSHRIPAVKITGEEKEGVPDDLYKLDTAALPKDISQADVVDTEMDGDAPCPEAPSVEVKDKPVSETTLSPRKRRKSGVEVEGGTSRSHDSTPSHNLRESIHNVFKLRKSPRLQTIPIQERDEKKKSGRQSNKMNTPKKTDKGLVTDSLSPNDIHQPEENQEGESSKKQGRKENDLETQFTNDSPEMMMMMMTPVSASCKTPQRNGFDFFKSQRSQDKLQVNQIWAINSEDKGMPSEYVKIRKLETKPEFMLRVTHAEPVTRSASCGEFRLKKGRPEILLPGRLSHQVKPVDADKVTVTIYPREGEVWALYKNCDGTKEEEYDIVEVVEDYCEGKEIAKVMVLTGKDSNSVLYIKQESSGGFIDIPKADMSSRFAHQIPAVRHKKRSTRRVEGEGYWELDPRAIPGQTIVLE